MIKLLKNFVSNDSGVTAIEYGLIAALVGVAAITGFTALGGDLNDAFTSIGGKIVVPA